MKVRRIMAALLAAVVTTVSLPVSELTVYAEENNEAVETVIQQPQEAGETSEIVESEGTLDAKSEGDVQEPADIEEEAEDPEEDVLAEEGQDPITEEASEENGTDELLLEAGTYASAFAVSFPTGEHFTAGPYAPAPGYSNGMTPNDEKTTYYVSKYVDADGKATVGDSITVEAIVDDGFHLERPKVLVGGKEGKAAASMGYFDKKDTENKIHEYYVIQSTVYDSNNKLVPFDGNITIQAVAAPDYTVTLADGYADDCSISPCAPRRLDYEDKPAAAGLYRDYKWDGEVSAETLYVKKDAKEVRVWVERNKPDVEVKGFTATIGENNAVVLPYENKAEEIYNGYCIRVDENATTAINDNVVITPILNKPSNHTIYCGSYTDETNGEWKVMPHDYNPITKKSEKGYSNIIEIYKYENGNQVLDEDRRPVIERYAIAEGATELHVAIDPFNWMTQPANSNDSTRAFKAMMGAEQLVVEPVYYTDRNAINHYKITREDEGVINGDVTITPNFVETHTVSFYVDGDAGNAWRLCQVEPQAVGKTEYDKYKWVKNNIREAERVEKDGKRKFTFRYRTDATIGFKIFLANGLKISSVVNAEDNSAITPDRNGVYSIKADADKTYRIITSYNQYTIPVTIKDENNANLPFEAAEITWGNSYVPEHMNNPLSKDSKNNRFISTNFKNDLFVKVKRLLGYDVSAVYLNDAEVAGSGVEGAADTKTYTLYKTDKEGDNIFRLATGSSIKVVAAPRPAVSVNASVDGESDLSKNKVSITGATKKTSGSSVSYEATNKEVTASYTLPVGRAFDSVVITIGDDEVDSSDITESVNQAKGIYTWKMSKSRVEKAWDARKNINFAIKTTAKPLTIKINSKANGKITPVIKGYTPAESESGVPVIGDEISSAVVGYNEDEFWFAVMLSNGGDEVYYNPVVKQDGKLLNCSENVTIEDVKYAIYKTNLITKDSTVEVACEPQTAVAASEFTVTKDSDVSFGTKAASYKSSNENTATYAITKATGIISFTVTTPLAKVPVVVVKEEGKQDITLTPASLVANKVKNVYTTRTYTFNEPATKISGKNITITQTDAPQKDIKVTYNSSVLSTPEAVITSGSGNVTTVSSSGGVLEFKVPEFTTVKFTASILDNKKGFYKLTKVAVNSQVQSKAIQKDGSCLVSFVAGQEPGNKPGGTTQLDLLTEGVQWSFSKKATEEEYTNANKYQNNSTISIGARDAWTLKVCNGDYAESPLAVASVIATDSKKQPVTDFAKLNSSGEIAIDASTASTLNRNPVTVVITGEDNAWKQTLKFNVGQLVSSVSAKNFKYDAKALQSGEDYVGAFVATQSAGSVAEYPLTLSPKGADASSLAIRYVSGSDESGKVYLASYSNGSLVLSTELFDSSTKKIPTGPVMVQFYDNGGTDNDTSDDKDIQGGLFVISPTAKFAAPGVKVAATTDIDMTLALTAPKGLDKYANLYYEITATTTSRNSRMMQSVVQYAPISDSSATVVLAKNNATGEGASAKYDVAVRIIQVVKDEDNIETAGLFAESNIFNYNGGAVKKTTATTRAPYETKLGLVKGTTSFISGYNPEGGVVLATAKFSNNTLVRNLSWAALRSEDGQYFETNVTGWDRENDKPVIAGDVICLSDDLQNVFVKDTSRLMPGKYTLSVYPETPNADYTPATIPVTVTAPVTKLWIKYPATKLYSTGKAVSMQLSAELFSSLPLIDENGDPIKDDDDKTIYNDYKPANTGVIWSVSTTNTELAKYLSITNKGKINVANGYKVDTETPDNNKFTVTAKPADGINDTEGTSPSIDFWVAGSYIEPAMLTIGNGESAVSLEPKKSTQLLSSKLNNTPIHVLQKSGDEYVDVDYTSVSLTVKPANGLWFESKKNGSKFDMYATANKTGKYTVTATANDGGKKSASWTVEVINDDVTGYGITLLGSTNGNNDNPIAETTEKEISATVTGLDMLTLRVKANCKTDGALCNNAAKVNIVGKSGSVAAALPTYDEHGDVVLNSIDYLIKPSKPIVEFTVTNGKEVLKHYKVTNNPGGDTVIVPAKAYGLYAYASTIKDGEGQVLVTQDRLIEFTLNEYNSANVSKPRFVFTHIESDYSKNDFWKSDMLIEKLNKAKFKWVPSEEGSTTGKAVLTVPDVTWLEKGKYTVYAALFDNNKPISKGQVKVVFDVANAPKPQTTILSAAEMFRDKNTKTENIINTAKEKNVVRYQSARVLNNNAKGDINKFDQYFDVEISSDNKEIYLKRKDVDLDADFDPNTDNVGWIQYGMFGPDGSYVEKTEKITVRFLSELKLSQSGDCEHTENSEAKKPEAVVSSGTALIAGRTVLNNKDVVFTVKKAEDCDCQLKVTYTVGAATPVVLTPDKKGNYKVPVKIVKAATADLKDITIDVDATAPQ